MNQLSIPLAEDELDRLDDFLLNRNDDETDTEDGDEGIFCLPQLDGFLTAIVSGPVMVQPSQWLPKVWGDCEPTWKDEKDFGAIFTLMIRHMNSISGMLMDEPEGFEPIFHENHVNGKDYLVVDEWCEGYLRGTMLSQEWEDGGEHIFRLLAPIVAFTGAAGWPGHELPQDETAAMQQAITPNVRDIHAYWLARRGDYMPDPPLHSAHDSPFGPDLSSGPPAPTRRSEPKTGRNDPCPCGSGRKFKQCCLH